MLGGPPSPLSTRKDFRSRLDRGVTTSRFLPPSPEGCIIQRVHPLSTSYGNLHNFSFMLCILWWTFSPLGTLFLSVFVIFILPVSAHIHCGIRDHAILILFFLGERTGSLLGRVQGLLFIFFVCLCMWRARHSQLLSATRTQFWLHPNFIADA